MDGTGSVQPFAGDGHESGSSTYDNRPRLQARFFQPTAVLPDAAGNVYVSDTHNNAIRKIANDSSHTVTTIAGALLVSGYADGTGAAARFTDPMGMDWLDSTHIVIGDSGNSAIRSLDVTTGVVSTIAVTHDWGDEADGPASSAAFFYPTAVSVSPDRRIFFLASSSGKLKVIGTDAGRTITTLVAGGLGYADGPGSGARTQMQMGLIWSNGTLIASDPGNKRLRSILPGTTAGGTTVKTWAGSGLAGADDGPASTASFQVPLGLWKGKDGNVYLVDGSAGALRTIQP